MGYASELVFIDKPYKRHCHLDDKRDEIVTKLNTKVLGYAAAVVSAAGMLILSILSYLGVYTQAAQEMAKLHMFYSVTAIGTITGMIEGAVIGFIAAYVFAMVYNRFV